MFSVGDTETVICRDAHNIQANILEARRLCKSDSINLLGSYLDGMGIPQPRHLEVPAFTGVLQDRFAIDVHRDDSGGPSGSR